MPAGAGDQGLRKPELRAHHDTCAVRWHQGPITAALNESRSRFPIEHGADSEGPKTQLYLQTGTVQ